MVQRIALAWRKTFGVSKEGLQRSSPPAISLFLALAGLVACGPPASSVVQLGDRAVALQTLRAAPTHGFGGDMFVANTSNLADRLIAYAQAQRGTDRDPAGVVKSWGMHGARYDASREFELAEANRDIRTWIASLPPPSPQYAALRAAFGRYQNIVQTGGWPQLPAGALHQGSTGPRVALLRQRLLAEAPLAASPHPTYFDANLVQALRVTQARFGLTPSGALDDATRLALNVPAEARLMQIKANLQRWRWAPREPSTTRIDVNIPSGAAGFYVNNRPQLQMRVAVGRPGNETPMLTSMVRSVVLNPPWNVPSSIAERELLPREQREPGYLASHGFVQVSDDGGTRLQQSPSPQSALGVVKFNFENSFGVYLHDTPSRAAFAQARRSVSHGCVRLERAVDLAAIVLARQGWSRARLQNTITQGQTVEVALAAPIPVRIFYWTAWVSGGQVHFRDDIYHWDEATAALADGVVRRPAPAAVTVTGGDALPKQEPIADEDYLPAQSLDAYGLGDEEAPEDTMTQDPTAAQPDPASQAPAALPAPR